MAMEFILAKCEKLQKNFKVNTFILNQIFKIFGAYLVHKWVETANLYTNKKKRQISKLEKYFRQFKAYIIFVSGDRDGVIKSYT